MMSVLPLLCALIAASSGAAVDTRWSTNYNDIFDSVIRSVKLHGPQIGLDPMNLPDVDRTFKVNILLQQLTAGIQNTNGVLNGATTLRRNGNVTTRIEGNLVYLDADVDFQSLNYDYKTRAEFMGLSGGGETTGTITDLLLQITLKLDMSNANQLDEELANLVIKSSGGLTIHFNNGITLLDQFLDAISDAFTTAFKDVIINYVKPEIEKAVKYAIEKIEENGVH